MSKSNIDDTYLCLNQECQNTRKYKSIEIDRLHRECYVKTLKQLLIKVG